MPKYPTLYTFFDEDDMRNNERVIARNECAVDISAHGNKTFVEDAAERTLGLDGEVVIYELRPIAVMRLARPEVEVLDLTAFDADPKVEP